MRYLSHLLLIAALVLISGCAPQTSIKQQEASVTTTSTTGTATGTAVSGGTPAATPSINLTPLSKYTDDTIDLTKAKGGVYSNSYTKLIITSVMPPRGGEGNSRDLPYNERFFLARAILGKEFSINLTAKVKVGEYESTIPLSSISHQSNSSGEKWIRAIYHNHSDFPLFLIRTDGAASTPTITFQVKGDKTYTSRGAVAALNAVLAVAKATTAPVSFVSKLTEQNTKDEARALDSAISSLFSSGITEQHWTDRDLRYWQYDASKPVQQGVKVIFSIPENENDWNAPSYKVGDWTLTFEEPRPSIFSDWKICPGNNKPEIRCATDRTDAITKVKADITPAQVLNYQLVRSGNSLGTVRAYLAQQTWFSSGLQEISSDADGAKLNKFCNNIANTIADTGLNSVDVGIVTKAVLYGTPGITYKPASLTAASACQSIMVQS